MRIFECLGCCGLARANEFTAIAIRLSPMDPNECKELKEKHNDCFYVWMHTKFLRGIATKDDCEDVFNEYQICLRVCLLLITTYFFLLFQKKLAKEKIESLVDRPIKKNPPVDDL